MKIFKNIIITIVSLCALFFGVIGIVALATNQEYVSVLNMVFEWFKGLSNNQ